MTGIIILNYATWEISLRCLQNIAMQKGIMYHIYLVDNASKEPMPKQLRSYLLIQKESITFLQAKENRGYAAGNNIGIAQALKDGCKYLLIANNDILFCDGAIQKLTEALDDDKRIGIVGPKIVNEQGEVQNSCCFMKTGIKEIFQLFTAAKFLFPGKRKHYYCTNRDVNASAVVYYVSGCCFAMSKACALAVTPFDEGTVLYNEEMILGIRMEQAGYRTCYEPQSIVVHQHAATTKSMQSFMYQCISQSELYYCSKYLHAHKWQLWMLYHYRRMLYRLRSGRSKALRDYWKTFERETREWYENLALYVRDSTGTGRRLDTVCDGSDASGNAVWGRGKASDSRNNTDHRY